MIIHENRLLAVDSHETSCLFFRSLGKISHNVLSASVVIGALRVNILQLFYSIEYKYTIRRGVNISTQKLGINYFRIKIISLIVNFR